MKEIDDAMKDRIADLYQNTKMSIGAIAHFLEISEGTIRKYKNKFIARQTRFK